VLDLRRPRNEALAVTAAVAVFVALAWFKAVRVPYPVFDDVDFLDFGNRIRAGSGPFRLWGDLFAGCFVEANRHPLYLALLALFARPEIGYHRVAQGFGVAVAALALLACWWVARRHCGRTPAAILAGLLAASGALVWTGGHECADALLLAFWALAIGAILDGEARDEAGRVRAPFAWLWAGVWAGLAYLTKGPGLFVPVTLGLTLLVHEHLAVLRDRRAWLFAGAFALTASPLWVRNVRVYGSPLYTANGRFLWIDRLPDFAEVFAPHADARLPHGAREYLAQTTPGALAWRVGMGLAETIFHLGDSLALVAPRPGGVLHVAWVVLGVLAAVAAVVLLWRCERGFRRTFLLVQCGWWFTFLVFYNSVAGASRYFLPLAATTLLPVLAVRLAAELTRAGSLRRSRPLSALGAVVLLAVGTTMALDPSPTRPPPGLLEVQSFLAQHLADGDVYAVDARTHLQPRWLTPHARQIIVSASWQTRPVPEAEMLGYLCEEHVRYVLLDGASEASGVTPGGATARYLFYDRLPLEPDGSLPRHGFPGGLSPVYVGSESPLRWMVLEMPPAACAPPALARAPRPSAPASVPRRD
jgi:4-amino-4-deoxy-L-arabinose transferase-like glycosyltransferase